MISLFIAGNLITVAQNNVSAKEKTADSNNVTRKDNQEYKKVSDIPVMMFKEVQGMTFDEVFIDMSEQDIQSLLHIF